MFRQVDFHNIAWSKIEGIGRAQTTLRCGYAVLKKTLSAELLMVKQLDNGKIFGYCFSDSVYLQQGQPR